MLGMSDGERASTGTDHRIASLAPAGRGRKRSGSQPGDKLSHVNIQLVRRRGSTKARLQKEVTDLSQRLNNEGDPAFASIQIKHAPVYKIVVSFADKKDRKPFLDSISPALRRHVQIRTVKTTRKDRKAKYEVLRTALASAGAEFIIGYDQDSDKYRIETPDASKVVALQALVPSQFKSDVMVVVAELPKPQAAPQGVQPGDWALAGYTLYAQKDGAALKCTLAYPVRYGVNRTSAILTAGTASFHITYTLMGIGSLIRQAHFIVVKTRATIFKYSKPQG